MLRNGQLKISKSLENAENGPLAKNSSKSLFMYAFIVANREFPTFENISKTIDS